MKSNNTKKSYQTPKVEQIQLDTEISLVMTSPPPVEPPTWYGPNPNNDPTGFVQKIFKL